MTAPGTAAPARRLVGPVRRPGDRGQVTAGANGDSAGAELPEEFTDALLAYERHLGAERGHGPNTRRAYLGDARDLLSFAARDGGRPAGRDRSRAAACVAGPT